MSTETWRRWERGNHVSERTAAKCEATLVRLERRSGQGQASEPESAEDRDPNSVEMVARFVKAWGPDGPGYLLQPWQACALSTQLDLFRDMDLGEWDPQQEPLHEVGPFRYFDKRVMMLVGENRAFVAAVEERCRVVAADLERGVLPFDTAHYLIDEMLIGAAIEAVYDDDAILEWATFPTVTHGNEDEGFFEVDYATETDWVDVAVELDNGVESMHWASPFTDGRAVDPLDIYSGGGLTDLLAIKHPFEWFEYLPPNASHANRAQFAGLADDNWLLSERGREQWRTEDMGEWPADAPTDGNGSLANRAAYLGVAPSALVKDYVT